MAVQTSAEYTPQAASQERESVPGPRLVIFGEFDQSGMATLGYMYDTPGTVIDRSDNPDRYLAATTQEGGLFYVQGDKAYYETYNPETGSVEGPPPVRLQELDDLGPIEINGIDLRIPGLPRVDSPITSAFEMIGRGTREDLLAISQRVGIDPVRYPSDIFSNLATNMQIAAQEYAAKSQPEAEAPKADVKAAEFVVEQADQSQIIEPDSQPEPARRERKRRKRLSPKQLMYAGMAAVTTAVGSAARSIKPEVDKLGPTEKVLMTAITLVGSAVLAKAGVFEHVVEALPFSGGNTSHANTAQVAFADLKPSSHHVTADLLTSPSLSSKPTVSEAFTTVPKLSGNTTVTSADMLTVRPQGAANTVHSLTEEVNVRSGDNLTKIVEHDLHKHGIEHPSPQRIADEVQHTSKLNADLLHGNPDHIETGWKIKLRRRFWKS